MIKMKLPSFLAYLLTSQAIVCITLIFDIPFVRQVLGFLYLIFFPGFIILRIFKLEKSSIAETILFSVGLSITFLIFIGLLINEIGPLFFASKPLSTEPLAVIINVAIILLCILGYLKNKRNFNEVAPLNLKRSLSTAFYIVLPFLSVAGIILAKTLENNFPLLLIIIIISILFSSNSFSSKSPSYYPLVLVSIAAILLLNTSLASNYIHGYDVHLDYFVFRMTKSVSYWNRNIEYFQRAEMFNTLASITVLPTIFSNILNMEEAWVFKIIFPLIFSLVPLALYRLHHEQWGKEVAFTSVIFFMSNTVFFDFRTTVRQMIADLFFLLIFLVLLRKDMNQTHKWSIIICFFFAFVASYYTMNYLFLALIFLTWLFGKIFVKNKARKINAILVTFFFVLTFLWHIYVVEGVFDNLAIILKYNLRAFYNELFSVQSRGAFVEYATSAVSPPSFLHQIGKTVFYVAAFFILIGFIKLIVKDKEKVDPEYFLLISINMTVLLMCILLPRFALMLQMDRMYHFTLLFLSPLFVIGGKALCEIMFKILHLKSEKKRETYSLILISTVLVTFFLFQTGFVYEVAKDPVPSSIPLSRYRMDEYTQIMLGLVNENDFFGALWLSKYGDMKCVIYSDVKARGQVLITYMADTNTSVTTLSNTTVLTNPSYIYLSRYNTKTGILLYDTSYPIHIQYNITEIYAFNSTTLFNNKLYSNGACEIYYYAS